MAWYYYLLKNFPQFVVSHTVKGFSIVNEADVFMEFSCFCSDSTDVGNLISGSLPFQTQFVYLEVHSLHTVQAWLGEL